MTLDTTAPPALLNSAWKQVEELPDDYDPEEWEEEEQVRQLARLATVSVG